MIKYWITSLTLALCLTSAAYAQDQTQTNGNANTTPAAQRNTSSRDGLNRKGGTDVGTRGSAKMKDGVSRSGNSNLSPTSPSNVPPSGSDKPGTSPKPASGATAGSANGANAGNLKKAGTTPATTSVKPKGTGTRNGNTESTKTTPVQTQGSTSEGSASKASPGGAAGTNTRVVRSVRPKSRVPALVAKPANQQPSAAGQASSPAKTGKDGNASQGSTNNTLTNRGQKEGSYSEAAKRNKTPQGVSKDPLKTGPNGQQTKSN